jgi:hypothetical protein
MNDDKYKPTLFYKRTTCNHTRKRIKDLLNWHHDRMDPSILKEMDEHFSYFEGKDQISERVMSRFATETISRFRDRCGVDNEGIRTLVALRFDNVSWTSMRRGRGLSVRPARQVPPEPVKPERFYFKDFTSTEVERSKALCDYLDGRVVNPPVTIILRETNWALFFNYIAESDYDEHLTKTAAILSSVLSEQQCRDVIAIRMGHSSWSAMYATLSTMVDSQLRDALRIEAASNKASVAPDTIPVEPVIVPVEEVPPIGLLFEAINGIKRWWNK